jgi:hypothetical protein
MKERKSEITPFDPRLTIKKTYSAPALSIKGTAYSTPRLSDLGSVETLSLAGTGSFSEAHSKDPHKKA